MASKRRLRRKACTGKVRYDSEAAARCGIAALRRKGVLALLVPYRCSFCGGFHFGHPPANVRRAINARR